MGPRSLALGSWPLRLGCGTLAGRARRLSLGAGPLGLARSALPLGPGPLGVTRERLARRGAFDIARAAFTSSTTRAPRSARPWLQENT
nr:hypothetical protein [Paraburkholderia fynbosensis]